jgi:hypothetical protein
MAQEPSYALTRFVLLRLLAAVYLCAFAVFLKQGLPLIGHAGLTPVDTFLPHVAGVLGSTWAGFWELPSIFWLEADDGFLLAVGWSGFVVSLLALAGFSNALSWLFLWALYMSISHVGQTFWSFGWENQLLETGFLAAFLCPLWDWRPFPDRAAPVQVMWLFRWLIFRIMLGAGLIKLRGDPCWRELTCLDYHFETQPIPNPISPYFHALPTGALHFGVVVNHLAEVVAPWLLFWPRRGRIVAGVVVIGFQLTLIISGNLSFLNWLTIVPALACFDDAVWSRVLPPRIRLRAHKAQLLEEKSGPQQIAVWCLCALVAVLSFPPVLNLLSSRQVMNTGHDPFDLVNSYGAFGSVGKERFELIFEGARETADGQPPAEDAAWLAYEFPCKPGAVDRRPCWMSPYHYRLDWQVWFAAMGGPDDEPWTVHLIWKLLNGDAGALSLLEGNPFPDARPKWIRVRRFRYHLLPPGSGATWSREEPEEWLPPTWKGDLRLLKVLDSYGWVPL